MNRKAAAAGPRLQFCCRRSAVFGWLRTPIPGRSPKLRAAAASRLRILSSPGRFYEFGEFSPVTNLDCRALTFHTIRLPDLRREFTARDRTEKLQITVESLHPTVRQCRNLFPEPGCRLTFYDNTLSGKMFIPFRLAGVNHYVTRLRRNTAHIADQ